MEEFLKLIGEWYQDYGYPVLFFGRAGTALGIDGLIARGIRKAKPLA